MTNDSSGTNECANRGALSPPLGLSVHNANSPRAFARGYEPSAPFGANFKSSIIQAPLKALCVFIVCCLTPQYAGAQPGSMTRQEAKSDAKPEIETETITLGSGEHKFSAYTAIPKSAKPGPAIILIHEWWGLNDWVKQQADRFAAKGYVAIAPDLYHGEVAEDGEHAHELMRGLADERAIADMKSAFDYLATHKSVDKKRIGIIGWCMGGGLALKLAIAEPKLACTVMCYGRPVIDVDQLKKIKGPLLGIWGATDRGIEVPPFEKALKEAGVKATHHIYLGAGHAFLNETNKRGYNADQAKKGWAEIDGFFTANLRSKSPM